MKRAILVVLTVALVITPCFAQEVETEGLFSLDGTLWRLYDVGYAIYPYFPFIILDLRFFRSPMFYYGFSQGRGYSCGDLGEGLECASDTFAGPTCSPSICYDKDIIIDAEGFAISFDSYLPIGIGTFALASCSYTEWAFCQSYIGIFIKVEDEWRPPGVGRFIKQ